MLLRGSTAAWLLHLDYAGCLLIQAKRLQLAGLGFQAEGFTVQSKRLEPWGSMSLNNANPKNGESHGKFDGNWGHKGVL